MGIWGKITCAVRKVGRMTHAIVVCSMMIPGVAGAAQPVIDAFVADPPAVLPGETVSLSVEAHDPDCSSSCTDGCGMYLRSDLTVWSADAGSIESFDNGVSASPYSASAVWLAPATDGTVTISVSLSDSATFMCGGRQTIVGELTVEVSATAGQEPVITSLVIDRDPVLNGSPATLTATAEDPQGDPITYSWTAARGTVTPISGDVAAYVAPPTPGTDTITCTVSDPGGASSSRSLEVTITSAVAESALTAGLVTPHDLTANRWGDLVVVDRAAGGLVVTNPASGELVRILPVTGVTAVAEDPMGRLVVGTATGLFRMSSSGEPIDVLDPGAELGAVTGISIDGLTGRIWVLYGSAGRVVAFDSDGTALGGFGQRGEGPGDFREPTALEYSQTDEILIADESRGAILVFTAAGAFVRTIGGFGNGAGEFTRVSGVTLGPGGRVYASDAFQSRVQVFEPGGAFVESLGTLGAELGEFKVPMGLTVITAPPRLAVTSAHSQSVQIFGLDDQPVAVPAASTDPGALDFGEVTAGGSSEPLTAQLINTGTVPVGVYGVEAPDAFDVDTDCTDGLAPGESCSAAVVFHPFRTGRVTGALSFLCGGAGAQTVSLEGTGIPVQGPLASLSPAAIDFGAVAVGRTSDVHTITLTNSGGGLLEVTAVDLGGSGASQFTVALDGCTGAALAAGSSCTIDVVFSPMITGVHDAALTVESSSSAGPVTTTLSGEAFQDVAIPTLDGWGLALMAGFLALAGSMLIRRRSLLLVLIPAALLAGPAAEAVDPPHWYFDMDCDSCHIGHNSAGGGLTTAEGNSNLCLSCHTEGGRAGALPILPSHTLATHHYDVTPDAPRWGSQMPQNPEMADRIMDGVFVCSTCHDQHDASASKRGRIRVSTPELLTAFGSTGTPSIGGSYTGTGGSSYLIEITIADSHFRYSKDGGLTWVGEADIGNDVPLDLGLTATFSGGTFALGERWRFSASFPFLRLPLDEGDNTTGDRFCRECHSLWAMDHTAVEGSSSGWMSHPVGDWLNANGKGYDRPVPLDGNGAPQGSAGADGNHSNDFNFDAQGMVQCLTCHGIHYADSNTLTEDGP